MWKILLAILLFASPVFAQEKPLIVGMAPFEPWVIEKNGVFSGISHDFLFEVVTRTGINAKFEAWPMARYFTYANDGKFDIAIGDDKTPFFEKHFKSIPSFFVIDVMLVSRTQNLDPSKNKLSIGKARGVDCPVFNKEQMKNIQFIDCDSVEQGLSLLAGGRVDALCTDLQTFYFNLNKSKHAQMKVYPQRNFSFKNYNSVFLRKELAPQYEERITKALKQMQKEKSLQKIYKKYGMDY